ncbi:splicesome-associated protein [Dendryphion nanum]|uniref:Splicesome-associated protein n=1 Tax=Dendryphion nanum TaxID=256645 RepID=A0A9P9EE50_9PLEO|nr:splicesome-associated protein [Dendryphion nanum]
MLVEEQRLLHEDLERLEEAITERLHDDPKHIRDRLARDHDIARFLDKIENQSLRLLKIYEDVDGERDNEVRALSTGDVMGSFQKEVASIRDFHRRYPNETIENLEKAYKKLTPDEYAQAVAQIETMFTGEEGFGRYFDLTTLHEQFLNLPVHQQSRRVTYLQYLDIFDSFTPAQGFVRRDQKLSESYFQYLKALQDYLEGFMRRTKPLENLDKVLAGFDKEFEELWEKDEVPGWEKDAPKTTAVEGPAGDDGIWCSACKKSFSNENVYEAHLKGKKHKKAEQQMTEKPSNGTGSDSAKTNNTQRFKERAVSEKEFRIKKLAAAMQTERGDTKTNVERKQGMTDRERQQELDMLYSESLEATNGGKEPGDGDSDDDEKISNPLKLPLDWSGKPIPYWLYKLHGLGNEFACEICGNHHYMGRRQFEKHFNENRHIYGLKCLGITNTTLFREITSIDEATKLWNKIQQDKKKEKLTMDNVVQMEDTEGNVMPEKIYNDLLAQGIL